MQSSSSPIPKGPSARRPLHAFPRFPDATLAANDLDPVDDERRARRTGERDLDLVPYRGIDRNADAPPQKMAEDSSAAYERRLHFPPDGRVAEPDGERSLAGGVFHPAVGGEVHGAGTGRGTHHPSGPEEEPVATRTELDRAAGSLRKRAMEKE